MKLITKIILGGVLLVAWNDEKFNRRIIRPILNHWAAIGNPEKFFVEEEHKEFKRLLLFNILTYFQKEQIAVPLQDQKIVRELFPNKMAI